MRSSCLFSVGWSGVAGCVHFSVGVEDDVDGDGLLVVGADGDDAVDSVVAGADFGVVNGESLLSNPSNPTHPASPPTIPRTALRIIARRDRRNVSSFMIHILTPAARTLNPSGESHGVRQPAYDNLLFNGNHPQCALLTQQLLHLTR